MRRDGERSIEKFLICLEDLGHHIVKEGQLQAYSKVSEVRHGIKPHRLNCPRFAQQAYVPATPSES